MAKEPKFVNRVCPRCGRVLQRVCCGPDRWELRCIIAAHRYREPLPIDVQLREWGYPMLPGMEEVKDEG